MKKAINLYFSSNDTTEKIIAIKNAGYDGIMLGFDTSKENLDIPPQVKLCNDLGLEISMIHCRYETEKLNSIWENGKEGDDVINDYILQVEQAKDFKIKNFVIHASGSAYAKNAKIGLNRLKILLKTCEKYNINLCVENLYSAENINFILKNISSKNLKFCFDTGHNNYFSPKSKLIINHKDVINTCHIHDNHGTADEHLILGLGTINQEKLGRGFALCNLEFLTAEIKFKNQVFSSENIKSILKQNLDVLNALDKKIEQFKS